MDFVVKDPKEQGCEADFESEISFDAEMIVPSGWNAPDSMDFLFVETEEFLAIIKGEEALDCIFFKNFPFWLVSDNLFGKCIVNLLPFFFWEI